MISSLEIRNDQNQIHLKEGQLEEAKNWAQTIAETLSN
jgi:hypothetical protein